MMNQNGSDQALESPVPDGTKGEQLAVDGLLRELARGPAEPDQDDELFVQRILLSLEAAEIAPLVSSQRTPAGSSRMRIPVRANLARTQKFKLASQKKNAARRSQWVIWVPVAACAAIIFSLAMLKSDDPQDTAAIVDLSSGCVLNSNGKESTPGKGAAIRNNDSLRVPQKGWATVLYSDGTRVSVQPGTAVTFQDGAEDISKTVIVVEGSVNAEVSKQRKGKAMVFLTPDVESRVLGTRLRVSVEKLPASDKHSSRVDVDEGLVRVRQLSDQASIDVYPGHYAVAAPGVKFALRKVPVELASGLAGHWKLDEGAGMYFADSSGQGNIGKLVGATWSPGRIGGGLSFAGREYVEISTAGGLNVTGEITFCAWIKLKALSRKQRIGGIQDGVGGGYKLSVIESNQLDFEIRDSRNTPHNSGNGQSGTILKNGVWYHVIGIYSPSGKYIKTYINGVLDRITSTDSALGETGGTFCVGAEPSSRDINNFHGEIDDVRVYRRVLNEMEIRALATFNY